MKWSAVVKTKLSNWCPLKFLLPLARTSHRVRRNLLSHIEMLTATGFHGEAS